MPAARLDAVRTDLRAGVLVALALVPLPVSCGAETATIAELDTPTSVRRPARPDSLGPPLRALVEQYAGAAEAGPDSGAARGELGLVYEANRLWPDARVCFEQAVALEPDDPVWALHLALARQELGEFELARATLAAAAERFADFAPILHRAGDQRLEDGDFDGALELFERAARAAPGAAVVQLGLGEARLRKGEFALAAEALERALQLNPSLRSAHYQLGLAYRGLGRVDEALRELSLGRGARKRFIADDGTSRLADLTVGVGETVQRAARLIDGGRADKALPLLEEARLLAPDDLRVLVNLGVAYLGLGRAEEAAAVLEDAAELAPREVFVLVNLAACHLQGGRLDEALATIERALEEAPEFAQAWLVKGRALLGLERPTDAEQAFREAERLEPRNPAVPQALARAALALERPDQALVHLARQAELLPGAWQAQAEWAGLAVQLGEAATARTALERARALAPDEPLLAELAAAVEELPR